LGVLTNINTVFERDLNLNPVLSWGEYFSQLNIPNLTEEQQSIVTWIDGTASGAWTATQPMTLLE